jgi:hypothetical protein
LSTTSISKSISPSASDSSPPGFCGGAGEAAVVVAALTSASLSV